MISGKQGEEKTMGTFDEYLERAKDLAEDASEVAKKAAGEAAEKLKEFTEEGGKAREMVKNAKEESAALAFGAKEKVQGKIQDARAIRELKQGAADLEALPEIEGSIIFTMEKETLVNSLRGLYLLIDDERLDDASVEQEIRKVMVKVVPSETGDDTLAADEPKSEEELAIANAENIAYSACLRALDSLKKAE